MQGNSAPASYRDTIPQLHVSCRDFYKLGISGLSFQRLSSIKHPRAFIKPVKYLQQALDAAASLTPTAFHTLHFLTKMSSLISEIPNMQRRALMYELYSAAKATITSFFFFGISIYKYYPKELLY